MSKQEAKALIPRLRFPEFKEHGEWVVKSLKPYLRPYSERVQACTRLDVFSSTREGLKPQSEYYDGKKLSNEGEYGVVPNGYFVYRHMSDDDVFKFNINNYGRSLAVSKEYPVFKVTDLSPKFLLNILNEGQEFKRFAISQKKGGTRTRLYFKTLCDFEPSLPSLEEQQKIADCLSSIDDLIVAEEKKLNGLKAHKKGLMQQLFPADGEDLPKLRFPEFDGVWGEHQIQDFAQVTTGGRDTQNKVDNGAYPFFVRSQTVESINSYSYDGEAILTSGDGVGVGKNFHYIVGKFDFHQRVYALYDFKNHVSGQFVFQYFSEHFYKRVSQLSAKNSVDSVRMAMITEMPIKLPSLMEQKKIAECLSSIDNYVTEQIRKIDTLKLHKKGLMQQLFPSMEEVGYE